MPETAVKERPIIFSAPMVRAILSGKKSQTRRVLKPQPTHLGNDVWEFRDKCFTSSELLRDELFHNFYGSEGSPYGSIYGNGVADRLWVRETHSFSSGDRPGVLGATDNRCWYRADNDRPTWAETKWRPSIYMPRAHSRILLEITDISIERLLDISEKDAESEGVGPDPGGLKKPYYVHFLHRWNLIHGEGATLINPWVWVVSFKRIDSE